LRSARIRILVAVISSLAIAACGFRTGGRVLIPSGYRGWVQIVYEVPAAPALRKENGKYLRIVPPSGILQTSSSLDVGYGSDEYFYVSSTGGRVRLSLEGVERKDTDFIHSFRYQSAPAHIKTFFVGSRSLIPNYPEPELVSSPIFRLTK